MSRSGLNAIIRYTIIAYAGCLDLLTVCKTSMPSVLVAVRTFKRQNSTFSSLATARNIGKGVKDLSEIYLRISVLLTVNTEAEDFKWM